MSMVRQEEGSNSRPSLKEKLAWFFREREIILRSNGRVRYHQLKSLPQMIAASAAAVFFAWLVAANTLVWWQEKRIVSKDAQIVEARVAYERLGSELALYQEQIAAMANDILADAEGGVTDRSINLDELAMITKGIEGAFDQISRDLDVTEADRRRIIQSRNALHSKISELENTLEEAYGRVASLQEDVEYRDERLEAERRTVASLSDSRNHWRILAEDFEMDLGAAQAAIQGLEGRLRDSTAALNQERARTVDLEDIRQRLVETVSTLETGLAVSKARGERLVINIDQLTQTIQSLEADRGLLESERRDLRADLATIEAELSVQEIASEKTRERLDALLESVAAFGEKDLTNAPSERLALALLEQEVGTLMSELRTARLQRTDMEAAISDVVLGLARITGASNTKVAALEGPDQKVKATLSLVGAVSSVQETQKDLILRLIDQAEADIERGEVLIGMAGLDLDVLMAKTGYVSGTGGPLEQVQIAAVNPHQDVLPTPEAGGTADLRNNVGVLEDRLRKSAALNDLMKCVPLISPVDNFQMTSKFGPRKDPITGQQAMHKGIDIGGWSGIKVHATAPGTVIRAGRNAGYGYMVEIDHGCGITTLYAHLRRIKVKKGDVVDHRAVVGTLGNTGRSTGPHVHYEVAVDGTVTDPLQLIQAGRFVHKI